MSSADGLVLPARPSKRYAAKCFLRPVSTVCATPSIRRTCFRFIWGLVSCFWLQTSRKYVLLNIIEQENNQFKPEADCPSNVLE